MTPANTISIPEAIHLLYKIEELTEDRSTDGEVHQDAEIYQAFRLIRDELVTRSAVRMA